MICSKCRKEINSTEINKKYWAVVEVTDLKTRSFGVTGAPYSGYVTVRGWQLEKIDEFSTQICQDCIDNQLSIMKNEAQKFKERFIRHQKFLIKFGPTTGGILCIGLLIAWLLDSYCSISGEWYKLILGIAAIMALLPVFNLINSPSKKEITSVEAGENLHNMYFDQEKSEIEKKIGKNISPPILHPEPNLPGPNPHKGLLFTVPESAVYAFEKSKSNTGWSRIDYYSKFGPNSPGPYHAHLQSGNLKNFGLNHWGEFLSLPASKFSKISGFSEKDCRGFS